MFKKELFRSLFSDGDPNFFQKNSAEGDSVPLMVTVLAIPLAALGGSFGSLLAQQAAATLLRAIRKASGPPRVSVPFFLFGLNVAKTFQLPIQPPLGDSRCCRAFFIRLTKSIIL